MAGEYLVCIRKSSLGKVQLHISLAIAMIWKTHGGRAECGIWGCGTGEASEKREEVGSLKNIRKIGLAGELRSMGREMRRWIWWYRFWQSLENHSNKSGAYSWVSSGGFWTPSITLNAVLIIDKIHWRLHDCVSNWLFIGFSCKNIGQWLNYP